MISAEVEAWFLSNYMSMKSTATSGQPDLLSKLTIVIPTYQRQDFILRQAVYWGGSQVQVVVLDGSASPLSEHLRFMLNEMQNFTYIHSEFGFPQRMQMACGLLETPYVATLSDDEFYLQGGLREAILALDNDSELVACNGQVLGFGLQGKDNEFNYFDAGYRYWRYEVKHAGAADRISYAMGSYNAATCYAVLRKSVWVNGWGKMQRWSSPYVGEIYQAIVTYIAGKLSTIEAVLLLRSCENEPVSIGGSFDRKISFDAWWKSREFSEEHEGFIRQLILVAQDSRHMTASDARQLVMNAVSTYVAFCEERQRGEPLRAIRDTVRLTLSRLIRKLVPLRILFELKRKFGIILAYIFPHEIFRFNRNLRGQTFAINGCELELNRIRKMVLEFNYFRDAGHGDRK